MFHPAGADAYKVVCCFLDGGAHETSITLLIQTFFIPIAKNRMEPLYSSNRRVSPGKSLKMGDKHGWLIIPYLWAFIQPSVRDLALASQHICQQPMYSALI
eukprot:Filipodium_phascolosomae@DN8245_c0_g1_i1.p1